jgi:hypothetical protein
MVQAKKLTKKMRAVMRKVKYLQGWFRAVLASKRRQRNVIESANKMYESFEARQNKLKEDWRTIKTSSHVEIHYNGISGSELRKLSISKYSERIGLQIGRIFRSAHEKAEIVYVTASPVPDEIQRYYQKMLELAEIKLARRRVHFLSIDSDVAFPEQFSTAAKILYSKRTLRAIKDIVGSRPSYLVPGFPEAEDIKLSDCLKVPILSGNPSQATLISKLSVSKGVSLH